MIDMSFARFCYPLFFALISAPTYPGERVEIYLMEYHSDWEFGKRERREIEGIPKEYFLPCRAELEEKAFDLSKAKLNRDLIKCPETPMSTDPFTDSTILKLVRARGTLNCGVSAGMAGFAVRDPNGEWKGFEVGLCRAVAAAVLGDPEAVEYIPTAGKTRFTALASGEVDMLARSTAWTFTQDTDPRFEFVGVNYYDGQGFMVPKELGVSSAKELNGATVCIQTGTTAELNLADFFRTNNISYNAVPIETNAEGRQQYLAGACDVYTSEESDLAGTRATFEDPAGHVLLPEVITNEPLGLLVPYGDDQWGDVVRWTLNALITAEELGVTSANIGDLTAEGSDSPEVNRLLGLEGGFGNTLGMDDNWAVRAISSVGNYGEIFEQNLGVNSTIGLARGLNAQWTQGGLLYSPPFR